MAALDLSTSANLPRVYNETLGTAGNVRLVTLPNKHGDYEVAFFPRATAAKLLDAQHGLAENAAIGATAYATLPADTWTVQRFAYQDNSGGLSIALASATSSQVVEIRISRAPSTR